MLHILTQFYSRRLCKPLLWVDSECDLGLIRLLPVTLGVTGRPWSKLISPLSRDPGSRYHRGLRVLLYYYFIYLYIFLKIDYFLLYYYF